MNIEKMMRVLVAVLFAGALTGCGDTWQGVKKDTGDNMEKTGEAVEKAGEKIKQ